MKSVMISIKPKWCELIANGKKTVEVRKTRPKIEIPFKCYIYCTKGDTYRLDGHRTNACKETFWVGEPLNNLSGGRYVGNSKVIGEFVCDRIYPICYTLDGFADVVDCQTTCLKPRDFLAYGKGKPLFGWHISDLVIYEKPKELEDFRPNCKYINDNGTCQFEKVECECAKTDFNPDYSVNEVKCLNYMTRPPQSWCYCEELEE